MSEFVRTLNAIKRHWDSSWLTDSQRECLRELQSLLVAPRTVNLFGRHGVGKTFLSWALSRESAFEYYPNLSLFQVWPTAHHDSVIIDNCAPGRYAHRDVLKALDFRGVRRAVLVTPALIRDYTYYCQLGLTSADLGKVQSNLAGIGVHADVSDVCSLWSVVNHHLVP